MSDFGWQRRGFLSLLGLDHHDSEDGQMRPVELAEAGIDPRTGGAVAITTKATLDGKDGLTRLKTYYWRMLPNGEQLSEKLFDMEFEPGDATALDAQGNPVHVPTMVPHAVWVLGRKLYDASDEVDHPMVERGPGLMRNLTRVMMAVGEVNHQLRDGQLPNVAKILDQCAVHDAVGERLMITGQSARGGFDFDAAVRAPTHAGAAFTVPQAVARALTGLDVNTLDTHQALQVRPRQATDVRSGTVFTTDIALEGEGAVPAIRTAVQTATLGDAHATLSIPCLTHCAWHEHGDSTATLGDFQLLGEDLSDDQHLTRMRGMGVTNRILHDMRRRRYPAAMDHLIEYDLHDLVYQFDPPPPLEEGGRLTMISVGGNNMEEIADGFGGVIGGNSKVIYHEGRTPQGKVNRVGVIIDLGLHLSPKDETDVSAAPDVIEHLKHCQDILITHRHLDHTDGLFAYIQYGYLRNKTIHATPEVIRAIRDKLNTYPSIHRNDLPTFVPLQGEGWLHVKDAQGNTRLSVDYARNATPHSARTTPFTVHGHYKSHWCGSYMNHGDARFGPHNTKDYKGKPVDADHLNKPFFAQSNRRLLAEVPGIDPAIAHRGPTYFDMDTTSILKAGWAPTEGEVEDNLVELSRWFDNKGMLLSMISTNDNRFETALRVATRADRDLTEFGANLEKTTTTANVLGVNDLRHTPGPRNNVQLYLDHYFEGLIRKDLEQLQEQKKQVGGKKLRQLEKLIDAQEARLEAFEKLKAMPHKFGRYQTRDTLESELADQFGEKITLGSVRVGRNSKTSRMIMNRPDYDWRRMALLTGTQGTNVEVDAALTALSEGRSLMDGNPDSSHTARPVDPQRNVVVISQTAIPGNDNKQTELVRKLTNRGFTVVQAVHDGFKIHHLEPERRNQITARLGKLGKAFEIEADGTLSVKGMPVHASGHGYEQDCRAWADLVHADVTAAQHTSDPQASQRMADICGGLGLRHMNRVVPNFEGLSIRAGASPAQTQIDSVGRTLASLIRIRTVRQQRKYYGGHLEAQRLVSLDPAGGVRADGLRATAREDGFFAKAFATRDAEQAVRDGMQRQGVRPEPVPENRMNPPGERPDQGPMLPGQEFRHRLFGRSTAQSAAFVRT
jgi:hypothetical protein